MLNYQSFVFFHFHFLFLASNPPTLAAIQNRQQSHQKVNLQMFDTTIGFSDLRTENVLINKDNGDLAALIDWQVRPFRCIFREDRFKQRFPVANMYAIVHSYSAPIWASVWRTFTAFHSSPYQRRIGTPNSLVMND